MTTGTVLVIDDERGVRTLCGDVLTRAGHHVQVAQSGEEAFALWQKQPFDLVLCDVNLPGIDGVEVLRRARELSPSLPIVLTTGYDATSTLGEATRLKAVELLQKPFRNKELVMAVRRVIARGVPGYDSGTL
jgi:CheY-like chemotaxis protein